MYKVATAVLLRRGWTIDPNPATAPNGEAFEFVQPGTGTRHTWTEALLTQHYDIDRD